MFDAKHGKGITAGFDLELTYMILCRALFVNSCLIEVDIVLGVPTHTIYKTKNMCTWGRNAKNTKNTREEHDTNAHHTKYQSVCSRWPDPPTQ
jgi:hypothetical protein